MSSGWKNCRDCGARIRIAMHPSHGLIAVEPQREAFVLERETPEGLAVVQRVPGDVFRRHAATCTRQARAAANR